MRSNSLFLEVELALLKPDALKLIVVLDSAQPLPELAGYYEILYDEKNTSNEYTRLVLYFPADSAAVEVKLELLLMAQGIDDYHLSSTTISRDEYLENYKKHYRPFIVGERLAIIPSWYRDKPELDELLAGDRIPLFIDPGLAFGTGQHPTTHLCLERLENILKPGERFLDIGCGSGILSLAALLLGADSGVAIDIDSNAVRGTQNNAKLNPEIVSRLVVINGSFDHPELDQIECDLLIANITANTLIENREALERCRQPRMILSGIITEDCERVKADFLKNWQLNDEIEREGWILLDLERQKK